MADSIRMQNRSRVRHDAALLLASASPDEVEFAAGVLRHTGTRAEVARLIRIRSRMGVPRAEAGLALRTLIGRTTAPEGDDLGVWWEARRFSSAVPLAPPSGDVDRLD
jgi:hypothetical protein